MIRPNDLLQAHIQPAALVLPDALTTKLVQESCLIENGSVVVDVGLTKHWPLWEATVDGLEPDERMLVSRALGGAIDWQLLNLRQIRSMSRDVISRYVTRSVDDRVEALGRTMVLNSFGYYLDPPGQPIDSISPLSTYL